MGKPKSSSNLNQNSISTKKIFFIGILFGIIVTVTVLSLLQVREGSPKITSGLNLDILNENLDLIKKDSSDKKIDIREEEEEEEELVFFRSEPVLPFYVYETENDQFEFRYNIIPALKKLPEYTTLKKAKFVIIGVHNDPSFEFFTSLPQRSPSNPYLVYYHQLLCNRDKVCDNGFLREQETRKDVLWVNYDLRDHMLQMDNFPLPRGITIAPYKFFHEFDHVFKNVDDLPPTKYKISFQGRCQAGFYLSSNARGHLATLLQDYGRLDPSVHFECIEPPSGKDSVLTHDQYKRKFIDSLNTTFGIVPHGDGRWNFRFSEVIGACSIPIVIADGLTMPYEQLIDWSVASIRIDEGTIEKMAKTKDVGEFLKLIPRDPAIISYMRRNVCLIKQRYFDSMEKRVRGLLMAAAAEINTSK